MKVKAVQTLEVDIEVPNGVPLCLTEVRQNAQFYGVSLSSRNGPVEVEVRMTGLIESEQLKSLADMIGKQVGVLSVA